MSAGKTVTVRGVDQLWRWAYFLAYRAARCWWFFRRPSHRGAYVAVWCADELLLIRNSYKSGYTVPCGGIGRGETPQQAALRELAEEVGIHVDPEQLLLALELSVQNEYKNDRSYIFEVELEQRPEIVLDDREVVWGAFCRSDELRGREFVPALREYLTRRGIS